MRETFNIYCDESCHLERDGQPNMVLGALWTAYPLAYPHQRHKLQREYDN